MLIGYCRVSTAEQSLDKYFDMLIDAGVDKRNIYYEKITGKKRDRPELERMLAELTNKDIVIVPDISRLSRSVKDLFEIVELVRSKGANIRSLRESWLDSTDARNKLLFTISAALAEFEASLISERTKEGLRAAKSRGRNGGRPSKRTEKAESVKIMYMGGMKIADIVKQSGLSRSTVNRIIRETQ